MALHIDMAGRVHGDQAIEQNQLERTSSNMSESQHSSLSQPGLPNPASMASLTGCSRTRSSLRSQRRTASASMDASHMSSSPSTLSSFTGYSGSSRSSTSSRERRLGFFGRWRLRNNKPKRKNQRRRETLDDLVRNKGNFFTSDNMTVMTMVF